MFGINPFFLFAFELLMKMVEYSNVLNLPNIMMFLMVPLGRNRKLTFLIIIDVQLTLSSLHIHPHVYK